MENDSPKLTDCILWLHTIEKDYPQGIDSVFLNEFLNPPIHTLPKGIVDKPFEIVVVFEKETDLIETNISFINLVIRKALESASINVSTENIQQLKILSYELNINISNIIKTFSPKLIFIIGDWVRHLSKDNTKIDFDNWIKFQSTMVRVVPSIDEILDFPEKKRDFWDRFKEGIKFLKN